MDLGHDDTCGRTAPRHATGPAAPNRHRSGRRAGAVTGGGGRQGWRDGVARFPHLGGRPRAGRERAVQDRFDHQDVHRCPGAAAARRRRPGPGGSTGGASPGHRRRGGDDRRTPRAHKRIGSRITLPWWERTPGSLRPELADVLGEQPHRHPVGRRFHYSNPGYTLLGALVEELRGVTWEEALRNEVLEPLGLHRTSAEPQAPHAGGWAVHPWADVMLPEPVEDLGRMAPAGQLWSTTGDLARFAVFLAKGDDRVLSAESVREMRTPAAPAEAEEVAAGSAYGLGMQVQYRDGRMFAGHSGSLPGFLAGLMIGVEDDLAAVVLANCTSGPPVFAVAADLVRIVAEAEPRIPEPWRPLPEVDRSVLELAGPLGNARLRAAPDDRRGYLARATVGQRPAFAFPGHRRRNLDGTRRLLRGRGSEGRTAPRRISGPPGPRVVRVHAAAVRGGGFRAGWCGS